LIWLQATRVIEQIISESPKHGFIDLDGHFGQWAAPAAGFFSSKGEIIATLDGDGQNDPNDLPRLIALLPGGNTDMVNEIRTKRQDNLTRMVPLRTANGFRNYVARGNVPDVGCSTRAF
jgi:dolichol-phosphate mannosyltransferase